MGGGTASCNVAPILKIIFPAHAWLLGENHSQNRILAEMWNNLQVKIYYFNTAHSKFEMLLTIFVASTEFLSFYTFVHLSQEPYSLHTPDFWYTDLILHALALHS